MTYTSHVPSPICMTDTPHVPSPIAARCACPTNVGMHAHGGNMLLASPHNNKCRPPHTHIPLPTRERHADTSLLLLRMHIMRTYKCHNPSTAHSPHTRCDMVYASVHASSHACFGTLAGFLARCPFTHTLPAATHVLSRPRMRACSIAMASAGAAWLIWHVLMEMFCVLVWLLVSRPSILTKSRMQRILAFIYSNASGRYLATQPTSRHFFEP